MKFCLEIDCDNDAFVTLEVQELAAVLLMLQVSVYRRNSIRECDGLKVQDSNGNTCGKVTVK